LIEGKNSNKLPQVFLDHHVYASYFYVFFPEIVIFPYYNVLPECDYTQKIAENAVAEKILSNTRSNLLKHCFRHLKTGR